MNPKNLYEYYTSKGQSLPSLSSRQGIAGQAGISNYSGTADQNNALLAYLQKTTSNNSATSSLSPAGQQFAQGIAQQSQQQPQTPNSYEVAKNDYSKAYQDYINSLNPSQEYLSAQQKYNEFNQGTQTSLQNIGDKLIPMKFITGQQASVADRANITGNRLQADISLADQQQQGRVKQNEARLGYTSNLLDLEQQRMKDEADRQYQMKTQEQEQANLDRQFNEDKRRFGLDYALKQQELSAKNSNKDTNEISTYRENAANNVTKYIDEALKQVKLGTSGIGSSVLGKVGSSGAANLASTLTTIKANIGFEALQAMREASKTGGALGQVAVQELEALQATLGSLSQKQSPDQLRQNLTNIKTHYENALNAISNAKNKTGGSISSGVTPSGVSYKIIQ